MKKLLALGVILFFTNTALAVRKEGGEIYSASWCGPCQQLHIDIARSPGWTIGESGQVHFRVIDDSDGSQPGINSLPTIIYYKNNKEVARIVGYDGDIKTVLDTYTNKVKAK